MNSTTQVQTMDEPVETAIAAISAGWATPQEIADAAEYRRTQRPLIGQLLLKNRKLNAHQVFEVLGEAATSDKPFGKIAIEKGFTTEAIVEEVVFKQYCMSPPLWKVLVDRGVITPAQADSIQASTRARLRKPLEAGLVASKS